MNLKLGSILFRHSEQLKLDSAESLMVDHFGRTPSPGTGVNSFNFRVILGFSIFAVAVSVCHWNWLTMFGFTITIIAVDCHWQCIGNTAHTE